MGCHDLPSGIGNTGMRIHDPGGNFDEFSQIADKEDPFKSGCNRQIQTLSDIVGTRDYGRGRQSQVLCCISSAVIARHPGSPRFCVAYRLP